jgi:acyl-CoA synthetase (AMP-forming)/AMP-acid ligase II
MPFPDYEPTVPNFLAHCVAQYGERPLILLGDRRISYAEAEVESAQLARGLLARGVGKGTRVGILFPNGPDWAITWLAAARIGALTVPINTFSKPRELHWTLRHADVDTLLTTPSLLSHDYQERLEQCAPSLVRQELGAGGSLFCPELPYLRQVFVFGGEPRPWARPADQLAPTPLIDEAFLREVEGCISPADPLIILYSSGSTAEPKGAVHTQGTLIRQSFNLTCYRDPHPAGVVWTPMPFFWTGGILLGLCQSMHEGYLVLCQEAFEPGATLELLERERATSVMGWPQYTQAMRDHPDFHTRDLSSIESGSMLGMLPEGERPKDPQLRSNSLGMTETCGPHTYGRMDVDLPESLRGSFGKALDGVTHKVVDPETGERLLTGEHGEICVRGYSLMQGLYKCEREDVFDEEGFYHTGDGGHFNEAGHLFFKARLGEMIKTGGANVTPREVEIVMDEMDEVQSSFVVGVPHPVRGQNVAAAVVLNEGVKLTADELRKRLREELSAYKVPRHFFFFDRDELPFTDSGKMPKKILTAMLTERLEKDEG